jgi:hypothetical protein
MADHESLHAAWCQAAEAAAAAELAIMGKDLAGLPVSAGEREAARQLRERAQALMVAALDARRARGD